MTTLEIGKTYMMRGGGAVMIDTKSQTEPPVFYGRQPDGRVTSWMYDGRTPRDRSGRTEYPSDFVAEVVSFGADIGAPDPALKRLLNAVDAHLDSLANYPESLVPINRERGTAYELREAFHVWSKLPLAFEGPHHGT